MEIISLSMYQYPCSVVLCMCVEYLGKKASFFRILLCSVSSIPVDGTMWYGEHFSWQAFSQLAPTYVRTHTHTDTKCRYSYNVHTYICAHTCAYMHVCACTHTHTTACTYVYMYLRIHAQHTCRHHERLQPSELHFECVICIKFRSKRDTATF